MFSMRLAVASLLVSGAAAACTPTPFNGLTAALVNPEGTVTGDVDATGCDIGVYFDTGKGAIDHADVHDALWFGVLVDATSDDVAVDVTNSTIERIGDTPFNGVQRGVGIFYRAYFANAATGTIAGNDVSQYQKGGIVVNGRGSRATVRDNVVTGLGPVAFIAQNGIQIGYGAHASVRNNLVSGNQFTGTSTVSGGIVVVGGPCYGTCPDGNPCAYTVDAQVMNNTAVNNDIGLFLTNLNGIDCGWPEVPTNLKVIHNTVSSDAVTNAYAGVGYQAGISDVGSGDKLMANRVSGVGYEPVAGDVPYLREIDADASFTYAVKAHGNK